jgi:hypothetical protein
LADALILLVADELGDAVILIEPVSETDCEEEADAEEDALGLEELDTDVDEEEDELGLAELEAEAEEEGDVDADTEYDTEPLPDPLALFELVGVAVLVDEAVAVDEKSGMIA